MTLAAALAGAVTISFSAIFFALSGVDAVTGAFFRTIYAVPALALIWLIRRDRDRRPRRRRVIALGAGVALGLDIVSWHKAIDFIGTGLATLLANTQVVWVAVIAWIFLDERPRRQLLWAIPVILAGVALVSGVGQGDAFGKRPLAGTGLALLAALFYSLFLLGFRQSNSRGAPGAGPLMEATAAAAAVTLLVGLIRTGIDLDFSWPAHGWLVALALGVQVLGWLLIGYALPRLPAAETGTVILIQPALTMFWGALIFAERPSALQILGAVVVLAGVGYIALNRKGSSRAMAA
ncbi:MAG: DMT family transporter [Acidimicrobiia bacterium]